MLTINEQRQKRAAITKDARTLLDKADNEKRKLTKEEGAEFDGLMKKADEMGKDIGRRQNLGDTETDLEKSLGRQTSIEGPDKSNRTSEKSGPVEWRDSQGRPVPVFGKEQRLLDYYKDDEPMLSVGKTLRGMITGNWQDADRERRAMSGGQDSAGGYLLSPQQSAHMIDLARNKTVVLLAGAKILPMTTSEMVLLKVETSPTAAWIGENQSITESEATFGRLTLRARKLAALVRVSKELVEDASNAVELIEQMIAKQIALGLDLGALVGDGDGEEPVGIFETTGVTTTAVSGNADYDTLLDAILALENVNAEAVTAIYTPTLKNWLAKLVTGDATNSAKFYLPAPDDVKALQTLITNQLATSQAVVGDFSQMLIGVRLGPGAGIQFEVAPFAGDAYAKDQWLIKARWRGDVGLSHANHFHTLTGISY